MGVEVHIRHGDDLSHPPAERRDEGGLHLHALDHGDDVAGLDFVTHLHWDRHDDCRGPVSHDAAVIARDAMRDAVDLDQELASLFGDDGAVRRATHGQAPLEAAEPLDLDVDGLPGDDQPVRRRAHLVDRDPQAVAVMAQLDVARHLGIRLRAAASRKGVEARALGRRRRVGELDRRLEDGDVRVPDRDGLASQREPIQPARVDGALAKLRALEKLEEEALVRRPAVDDHGGLGESATQASEGLGPVRPPGDDLGDHRVELGRDDVPLGDAGVDPHAGPRGQPQQLDQPRGRREVEGRILGIQPGLDRVAACRRRLALEPPAGGDVELELDQVGAGGGLRDRVLHLEARVDLHERERLGLGLVEELDRAGVVVFGSKHEPHRRIAELLLLDGGECGAGRLLDDLLVAPLHRAVAHAQRPRRPVAVGDDLHLDVAGGADDLLEQDVVDAEGLARLGARAIESPGQGLHRVHAADAASTAAGHRLDHEREADGLGVGERILDVGDRAPAPRGNRHPGGLGQELGLDLVPQAPHDVGLGADEDDAQALAQVRELRLLGYEAPAHPRGLGPCRHQGAFERVVVQVAVDAAAVAHHRRRRADAVSLVGLAHEHRAGLWLGVERDRPNRRLAQLVELAHGMDEPHGGLAAVDDRQPLERLRERHQPTAALIAASASLSS